jgi:hypothetical protein
MVTIHPLKPTSILSQLRWRRLRGRLPTYSQPQTKLTRSSQCDVRLAVRQQRVRGGNRMQSCRHTQEQRWALGASNCSSEVDGGSRQWRSEAATTSTKGVVALATAASGHLDSGEIGSMKGKGQNRLQQRKQVANSVVTVASGHLDGGELPQTAKGMGRSRLEQRKAAAISYRPAAKHPISYYLAASHSRKRTNVHATTAAGHEGGSELGGSRFARGMGMGQSHLREKVRRGGLSDWGWKGGGGGEGGHHGTAPGGGAGSAGIAKVTRNGLLQWSLQSNRPFSNVSNARLENLTSVVQHVKNWEARCQYQLLIFTVINGAHI